MQKYGKYEQRLQRFLIILFLLAIPNLILFVALAVMNGGYAGNGYANDGHYFVGAHGTHTEVSYEYYIFSYWHFYLVLASLVLPLLYGLIATGLIGRMVKLTLGR